uniref:Uncharacterized protein n=1 Tax=Ditylenchus dipsaci TaxID=166011 RepID=A0A915E5P4_9BILA
MKTTAILSTITKIREENMLLDRNKEGVSVLHNHIIDYDDVMRKICIHAEIRPDCLDHGSHLTEISYYTVVCTGIIPGDDAVQIISKKLEDQDTLSTLFHSMQR